MITIVIYSLFKVSLSTDKYITDKIKCMFNILTPLERVIRDIEANN